MSDPLTLLLPHDEPATLTPCQEMPAEEVDRLFFADPNFPQGRALQAEAKALCMQCPLYHPCAEYALREGIPNGVFGGLGDRDRAAIWKASKGGRPQAFNKAIDQATQGCHDLKGRRAA